MTLLFVSLVKLQTVRKVLTFTNLINPIIKIKMELEKVNRINFLDLTINKLKNNYEFSIFRLPTVLYISINKKFSEFSMIHRLVLIDKSQVNFKKEQNITEQIAFYNRYKI